LNNKPLQAHHFEPVAGAFALLSRPVSSACNMTNILTANRLTKEFGRVRALDDVSFHVEEGEVLGLIGPNGAGKTTLFNVIAGSSRIDKGTIKLDGEDITRKSPSTRCRLGIGRTYQVPRPFETLTVYENVLVSAVHGAGRNQKEARSEVRGILELSGLAHRKSHFAKDLNVLERKLLELAKVLGSNPRLLLLDEIAAGLTEVDFQQVLKIVGQLRGKGRTVIWVEHIPRLMTQGVDRLLVLAEGKILASGKPGEVMSTQQVADVYLGRQQE